MIKAIKEAQIPPAVDCESQCPIRCSTDKCPCVLPCSDELVYPPNKIVTTTTTPRPAYCDKYCPQAQCYCPRDNCTAAKLQEWIVTCN